VKVSREKVHPCRGPTYRIAEHKKKEVGRTPPRKKDVNKQRDTNSNLKGRNSIQTKRANTGNKLKT